MKLSICIPVYNFDVRELVFDLKKEIENNKIDAEIILIDDASEENFKIINSELQKEVQTFICLENNIGRARIRNLFLDFAKGDYFLFLDCDGKILSDTFLSTYVQFVKHNPGTFVVYGGRKVSDFPSNKNLLLRWKFAVERENLLVKTRLKNPFLSFQTNNFLIKKEIFRKIHFNPEFQQYGYEDLLFAMDLKVENIVIDHIDNSIFNDDLETNAEYLLKVKESIDSLSRMLQNENLKSRLAEIKLVKVYNRINKPVLKVLLIGLFQANKRNLEKLLLKGSINLKYLDFYKLGLLLQKMR
jgi:cellulose synthase/poly-beta-1,6-N-acetylglucosamine synthase-like glycosyltransferase